MQSNIRQTETFKKWLHKDVRAKANVLNRITMIQVDGNFGDHRNLGGGLHELRIFTGQGYRVYHTIRNKQVVLLLAGGIKNTQQADIEKAKKILKNL